MAHRAAAIRFSRLTALVARGSLPWTVMVGGFLVFQVVRGAANEVGSEPLTSLGAVDRTLALGVLPSSVAQSFEHTLLTALAQAIHLTFFTLPLALGVAMTSRQSLFSRFAWALTCSFAIGGLIHAIVPAAPPWLAESGVNMLLAPTTLHELRLATDPNPYAALPSMHLAVATVSAFVIAGRFRALALFYPLLMTWALIYLGEHYLVDCIAGVLVGALGWRAAGQLTRAGVAPTVDATAGSLPMAESPLEGRRAA